MKRLTSILHALMLSMAVAVFGAETVPMVYGVRIASSNESHRQALVSFPANNPALITDEVDLSGYNVLTAACDGSNYFMVVSADGIVPSAMMKLNLDTKSMATVAAYDWKVDLAGSLLLQDMTFDPQRKMLYAIGYDLSNAELVGEEVDAPFGVFAIDPVTGKASSVGYQDVTNLWTLAANGAYEWLSVADDGSLWLLNSANGSLDQKLLATGVTPCAQQSMSFDLKNDVCYWASVSVAPDGENYQSMLRTLAMGDNWQWQMSTVGALADNTVLIGLYVDPDATNADAPAQIKSLTATPGQNGASTVKLAWTNPSLTMGGSQLAGQLGVKIYRDSQLAATIDNSTPGAAASWTDSNVATGRHTYSVAPFNSAGEGKKCYAPEFFVGVDTPGAPLAVSASKSSDGKTITVTWNAPTDGANGGWFDSQAVSYNVVRMPGAAKVASGLTNRSFADTDVAELHGYYYIVSATTAAGEGPGAKSNVNITGEALCLPYRLNLADEDNGNLWTIVNGDGDVYAWYINHDMWGGTSNFFRYYPENTVDPETMADEWLISPAMKLEKGKYYVVSYSVRLLHDLFPANSALFIGRGYDTAALTTELERNERETNDIVWTQHAVPFSVETSGDYNFGYQVSNMVPVQFNDFAVDEVSKRDLTVAAPEGNTMLNAGETATFKAVVLNNGFESIDKYKVELVDDAGGAPLAFTEVNEPLACYASATVEIRWTPEAARTINLKTRVVADGDLRADNDLSTDALQVNVSAGGTTIDITDGTTGSGYVPFYPSYKHSATQTIYTADELSSAPDNHAVTGLKYYIYNMYTSAPHDVELEVALANVDDFDNFEEGYPIQESVFTTVFNGVVSISKENASFTIALDKPFDYAGGNLCVYTRHLNVTDATPSVIFCAKYDGASPKRSIVYRDSENPFDFSQEVAAYKDRPNLTIFMQKSTTAIPSVEPTHAISAHYDRSAKTLSIDGDYTACRVFSPTGLLLGEYSGSESISLQRHGSGMAIVEITHAAGRSVSKIIL